MIRESMLGYLLRKQSFVMALADSAENRRFINLDSALQRIQIQKSQIAPINNRNSITGEGITKDTGITMDANQLGK